MITLQKTVCAILRNLGLASRLWNKVLDNNTEAFASYSLFQTTIKID